MASETFLTPLIDRDLIGPNNTPMGAALNSMTAPANPYRYTNLLGGVTMSQPLAYDAYGVARNMKARNLNLLTKTLGIAGAGIATLFVGSKFGKLFKSIGKVFSK